MDTWKMLVLARNKTYPYLTLSFDFGKEKIYVILIAKCCLVRIRIFLKAKLGWEPGMSECLNVLNNFCFRVYAQKGHMSNVK